MSNTLSSTCAHLFTIAQLLTDGTLMGMQYTAPCIAWHPVMQHAPPLTHPLIAPPSPSVLSVHSLVLPSPTTLPMARITSCYCRHSPPATAAPHLLLLLPPYLLLLLPLTSCYCCPSPPATAAPHLLLLPGLLSVVADPQPDPCLAAAAAAARGIEWDAIELPSQFMENWCYDTRTLYSFAKHYSTGEPLPQELFKRLKAAKTFRAASMMLRQVHFSCVDLELHSR